MPQPFPRFPDFHSQCLTPLITLNQEKEKARRAPGFLFLQRMARNVHLEVHTYVMFYEYFARF
jgi:hypothetical protein